METNEIFAQRIKGLRESRGMGVRELAARLGIGHSSLSLYENLKREPNVSTCKIFADFFGVSCDYLLGLTDDPKPFRKG